MQFYYKVGNIIYIINYFFYKVFPRNCNFDEKSVTINPEILCKNKLEEFRDKNL